MPYSSSTSLTVSTSEWMPSLSIAELPVSTAAMNFVRAIARFAASATRTTLLPNGFERMSHASRGHHQGAIVPPLRRSCTHRVDVRNARGDQAHGSVPFHKILCIHLSTSPLVGEVDARSAAGEGGAPQAPAAKASPSPQPLPHRGDRKSVV